MAGDGGESAVFAHLGGAGILFGRAERHRFDVEAEVVDGFLDEIGVAVADVLKVGGGDAHKKFLAFEVGKSGRLQPCFVGLAIDLLLERSENADPIIQYGGGRRNE
jgi:hypothetical protein